MSQLFYALAESLIDGAARSGRPRAAVHEEIESTLFEAAAPLAGSPKQVGDGVDVEPDWDEAAQVAPVEEVDQRISW